MLRFALLLSVMTLVGCNNMAGPEGGGAPTGKQAQASEAKPAFRAEIFDPVYRAAMELKSGQEVGMNRAKFGELLQKFSTEVSIANDKAESAAEQKIAEGYSQVLDIYKDAAALWDVEFKIPDYRKAADYEMENQKLAGKVPGEYFDFCVVAKVGIPINLYPDGSTGIEKLIERYNLPVEDNEGFKYTPTRSVAIIWSKATEKNDEVNKLRKSSKAG